MPVSKLNLPNGAKPRLLHRLLITAVLTCLGVSILLATILLRSNPGSRLKNGALPRPDSESLFHIEPHDPPPPKHKLGVIIPFRDRHAELERLAPHLHQYLLNQSVEHVLIVVSQDDSLRFNRAALINVGFLHATTRHAVDYIVMHDVDLLPLNPALSYEYPPLGSVYHVSSPDYHPKYSYNKFIGGVLVVPADVYRQVNGMSNVYFGWGLEDDEFYVRLVQAGVEIHRPSGLTTDRSSTFLHLHSDHPRDQAKCNGQLKRTRRRDRLTGLGNVNYTLRGVAKKLIGGAPVEVLSVELVCDRELSPWCECGGRRSPS